VADLATERFVSLTTLRRDGTPAEATRPRPGWWT
jgi:hypothetical protein